MNKLILEEIQRMTLLSKYDNSKTLSEQGDGSAEIRMNRLNQQQLKDAGVAQAAAKAAESTKAWVNYPCVTGNKSATKSTMSNGSTAYNINGVFYYANGRKKLANGTMANYTCNDAEFKSGGAKQPAKPIATPPELKDIKAFQDWLDVNAKGWATGYKDGIINKGQNGGGYGKFGPRTQKAWATYKDQFLKGGDTATQTPPEIEGEDNTQTIDPNDGEYGGGATTEQPAKVETPPTNDPAVTLQGNPQSAITPGKLEPASGAVYGQQYKSSDGKTYVWNGTEYQPKSQPVKIGPNQEN